MDTPPAVLALLANDTQLYFSVMRAVEGNLRSGKLKALAVASAERLGALPDVPTTSEAGFPGLQRGNWWGLAAPRGTDQKIIDRLAGEVRAALADPAVASRYAGLGMFRGGQSPAEFAAQLQAEAAKWKRVIETAGLRAE